MTMLESDARVTEEFYREMTPANFREFKKHTDTKQNKYMAQMYQELRNFMNQARVACSEYTQNLSNQY